METEAKGVLEEAWNAINARIKHGPLSGNGTDETAERNGLILASNIIMGMRETGINRIETLNNINNLIRCSRNSLAQQRKEFRRGEILDLDQLEDALEALRRELDD